MDFKIKKYKEVSWPKDRGIALPIKRKDGKSDFLTIEMREIIRPPKAGEATWKVDNVIYINNRFMGACLKIMKDEKGNIWESPFRMCL